MAKKQIQLAGIKPGPHFLKLMEKYLILIGTILGAGCLVCFGSAVFLAFKSETQWPKKEDAPLYDPEGVRPCTDTGAFLIDKGGNRYRLCFEGKEK